MHRLTCSKEPDERETPALQTHTSAGSLMSSVYVMSVAERRDAAGVAQVGENDGFSVRGYPEERR